MQSHRVPISSIVFYLLLLSLASVALAQVQEYKDYTVEQGDTLWDITKEELKDPFLWPKVWTANPDIDNPDKIYPNQKIKIPLFLLQRETTPPMSKPAVRSPLIPEDEAQITTEKPSRFKKEYLIDKNTLILSGYIADSVHSVGTIYDKPGEATNLAKGDYAYIRTNNPVKKGDKFYVIDPVEKVKHPVTGQNLGVRISILGTAEVVDEKDPKVLITTSYVEIPVGSLIDNYYEIEPPPAVDNPRKPEISGHVVTTFRRLHAHGNLDIVFIDRGENDGLEEGDLLATTLQNAHTIYNGIIQIISKKPSTSAAIIRKAGKEIRIADPVTAVRQE